MTETSLDRAHIAMQAAPEDEVARLEFYHCLADSELFLLLVREAEGARVEPEVFEFGSESCVLVFDQEERLADFVGTTAPYAALSGRALVGMLQGQGIGLGLNPEVAPSSTLLPPEAVDWLAETLAPAPEETEDALAKEVGPPDLSETVLAAIEARLIRLAGVARAACLVSARFEDGDEGHLLAIFDVLPAAQAALAKAMSEVQLFSGEDKQGFDIAFFSGGGAMAAKLKAVGRWFDLPAPQAVAKVQMPGAAPGMDPDRPPILK
jgi:hypothetical protein